MIERSESGPVPDPPGPAGVSQSERRFEVFATALLAFAALATAWSGYQASLWDGVPSSSYTQASAARTNAAQKHTEANQYRLADLSVFENFIDASLTGDTELFTVVAGQEGCGHNPRRRIQIRVSWSGASSFPGPLTDGRRHGPGGAAGPARGAQWTTSAVHVRNTGCGGAMTSPRPSGRDDVPVSPLGYRARFSDQLEPAYEAWVALDPQTNPDAPASPLTMTEYRPPQEEEAHDHTALAEEKVRGW